MSSCMQQSARATLLLALLAILPATARAQQVSTDAAAAAWAAGDNARARELYAARVREDSTDVQALHRLALLYAWNRRFDEALPLFRRLVEGAPSAAAHLDFARALAWAGRYDDAAAKYRALLAGNAHDAGALRGLAQVTTWRGDLAQGERLWRDVLAHDAADAEAHTGLSQLLRWQGRAREALAHAHSAAVLQPQGRDAREQLAWAEAAFRPGGSASLGTERDSDSNAMLVVNLAGSVSPSNRLRVTASGALRRAEGMVPGGEAVRESRVAALAARLEVGNGWMLGATGGINDRTVRTSTAWDASVASPAWSRVAASASYAHRVVDYTADLIGRDITADEAAATLAIRVSPSLRLDAGVAFTTFEGQRTHQRTLVRAAVDAAVTRSIRVRPRATAFRFDEPAQEGYFAPGEYVLAETAVAWEQWRSGWSFSAEVAPGAQRIGSTGDVRGALSASARLARTLSPGRDIALALSASNLGVARQVTTAAYRHTAATLSLRF
jgi:tetratricopeptide (TPR) repeat protein